MKEEKHAMEEDRDNGKKTSARKTVLYLTGSVILCVISVYAIPKVFPYLSGALNKFVVKYSNQKHKDDDWGPVLVKKT